MSIALFKRNLKSEYKLFLIFTAIVVFYSIIMVSMYSMFTGEEGMGMEAIIEMMPEVAKMFGFASGELNLLSFLCSYLYGMILLIFPMIFAIILAFRLVARHVDKGSAVYLLASPLKRSKIILTQALFFIAAITALILINTLIVIIVSVIAYPEAFNVGKFLLLNFGLLMLHLGIGGICFFFSAFFNSAKMAIGFSAGVCIAFFLFQMIGNMGGNAEFFKYLTVFSLFDAAGLIELKALAIVIMFVLPVIAAGGFFVGGYRFVKKDMCL